MKKCDTCIYRNNVEQLKPCVVYRDDCEHYKSDSEYEIWNGYHGQTIQPKGTFDKIWEAAEREEDMNEVGVEIVKTEETEKSGIKYLNINVSNSEVERKPDIVRLCADAGILEYVKPKTGHWISRPHIYGVAFCSECGFELKINNTNYCPNCGARMAESENV